MKSMAFDFEGDRSYKYFLLFEELSYLNVSKNMFVFSQLIIFGHKGKKYFVIDGC
jgi:hypothetical protein